MTIEQGFVVFCDDCEELLEVRGMHAWQSEDEATEAAEGAGWKVHEDGDVFCRSCAATEGGES